MNDRYLFRGKRTDNGDWVTGNLVEFEDCPQIIYERTNGLKNAGTTVDPDTIGQCIGASMFEGDVLYGDERDEFGTITSSWTGIIKFDEEVGRIRILDDAGDWYETDDFMSDKVIGNIHDNPELSPEAQ